MGSFNPSWRTLDTILDRCENDEHIDADLSMNLGVMYDLCKRAFGGENLDPKSQPWKRILSTKTPFPDELFSYIEAVACSDRVTSKSWDSLLVYAFEREQLAMAIMWKVFDKEIFSDLLFGASKAHKKVLKDQDEEFKDFDGFERTQIRANLCGAYVALTDGQTPHFWEEVDRVTSQTMNLLLPIYNIAGRASKSTISVDHVCQLVHNLVAAIARVATMLRCAPGIVEIKWYKPGSIAEPEQENMLPDALASAAHHAEKRDQRLSEDEKKKRYPGRRPRTKISVIPQITRWTPAEGGLNGYDLQRPRAVFYMGWFKEEYEHKIGLRDLVKSHEHPDLPWYMWFCLAVLFAHVGICLKFGTWNPWQDSGLNLSPSYAAIQTRLPNACGLEYPYAPGREL